MTMRRKLTFTLWILVVGAVPAWANNAPQPDGVFSLILIFPVVILGFRLAGAEYTQGERKWRVGRGLLLGLAVFFSIAGTELAMLPMVILLIFGCMRGVQILIRGQGSKRILIGTVVCLWTLFAVSDYFLSLTVYSPVHIHEVMAVGSLHSLAKAEQVYASRDASQRYATIQQLREAQVPLTMDFGESNNDPRVYDPYLDGTIRAGYRYNSSVHSDGKGFLITAVPATYEKDVRPLRVPGASWWYRLRSPLKRSDSEVGQRTFAVDETGVIRAADLGTTRPITREEAEKWKALR